MSDIPKSKRTIPYSEFYDKAITVREKIMETIREDFSDANQIKMLPKYGKDLDIGTFGFDTVLNQYKSWRGNVVRKVHKSSKSHGKTMYANHKSIRSLDKYFKQLFWKELKENNIKLDF